MEILEKYKFYLILGGVLVGYLLIYMVFVTPISKNITKDLIKLESKKTAVKVFCDKYRQEKRLPTQELVQFHEEHKRKLNETLQSVLAFFSKRDKDIEKWFPEIEKAANNTSGPELSVFLEIYDQRRQELINKFVKQDAPFIIGRVLDDDSFEDTRKKFFAIQDILRLPAPRDIVTETEMKLVQKQYWILVAFLEILERGKLKVLSTYKFTRGEDKSSQFNVHTLELVGKIDYEDVPFLLQEIFNNPKLMLEVTAVNVQRDKEYRPPTYVLPIPPGKDEKQVLEEWKKSNKGKDSFPPIFIKLGCRLLDYREME